MRGWPAVARAAAWSAALYSAAGLLYMYSPVLLHRAGRAGFFLLCAICALPFLAGLWRDQARIKLPEAALGLGLGVLAGWSFWWTICGIQLQRTIGDLSRQGFLIERPEVQVPPGIDVRPLYGKLDAMLDASGNDWKTVSQFLDAAAKGSLTQSQLESVRLIVAKHSDALAVLDAAAALPDRVWPVRFRSPDDHGPSYRGILGASRLAAARAVLLAREGESDRALASLQAALAASECAAKGSTFLGTMADVDGVQRVAQVLPLVLSRAKVEPADRALRPLLQEEARLAAFHTVMRDELFGITVRLHRELSWWEVTFGRTSRTKTRIVRLMPYFWPFVALDMDALLRSRVDELRALDLPYEKARVEFPAALARAYPRRLALYQYEEINYVLNYGLALRGVAYAAIAREELDARAYRAKHGRWPTRAEEKDPFTGQPLKLASMKDSLLIYSVGPDLKDDKGAAFDDVNRSGDLAVRL